MAEDYQCFEHTARVSSGAAEFATDGIDAAFELLPAQAPCRRRKMTVNPLDEIVWRRPLWGHSRRFTT